MGQLACIPCVRHSFECWKFDLSHLVFDCCPFFVSHGCLPVVVLACLLWIGNREVLCVVWNFVASCGFPVASRIRSFQCVGLEHVGLEHVHSHL